MAFVTLTGQLRLQRSVAIGRLRSTVAIGWRRCQAVLVQTRGSTLSLGSSNGGRDCGDWVIPWRGTATVGALAALVSSSRLPPLDLFDGSLAVVLIPIVSVSNPSSRSGGGGFQESQQSGP